MSNKKYLPNPKVDKEVKKKSYSLGGKSGGQIISCKTVHVVVQSLSRVQLLVAPWTAARQAPLLYCSRGSRGKNTGVDCIFSSSGAHFVRTLHYDLSAWVTLHSMVHGLSYSSPYTTTKLESTKRKLGISTLKSI